MKDRLSIMLKCMVRAVDEGFSYDGIVSVPDYGLEDFGRRPGLLGWFDDIVERFRKRKVLVNPPPFVPPAPVAPVAPTPPVAPVPVDPTVPSVSVTPVVVTPIAPVPPVGPVAPDDPVAPVTPVVPVSPTSPSSIEPSPIPEGERLPRKRREKVDEQKTHHSEGTHGHGGAQSPTAGAEGDPAGPSTSRPPEERDPRRPRRG